MEEQQQQRNRRETTIADLPEELLHKILCFLPTQEAVKTCPVSHKWRYLWIFIQRLWFNYDMFECDDGKDKLECFNRFIDHVLLRLNPSSSLERLSLVAYVDGMDPQRVESWVFFAMRRKVKEVRVLVNCNLPRQVRLPRWFFTSDTVTSLHLKGTGGQIMLPDTLGLTNVKNMFLQEFINVEGDFLSDCVNVESLALRDVWGRAEDKPIIIRSSKLQVLDIVDSRDYGRIGHGREWTIYAPSLKCFFFEGKAALKFTRLNLDSIQKVLSELPPTAPDTLDAKAFANLRQLRLETGGLVNLHGWVTGHLVQKGTILTIYSP